MDKFIPTDEQWEKMKRHIKSEAYKKEDFFVFETLAIGDKIVPNRYTRITPELLNVMAEDAKKGVSLMLNHNWSASGIQSIPIGKVFDSRIAESSQEGETLALYFTQYILRDDSKVDGYSKNDIIKLIESGIMSDTSIGWTIPYANYKCNICGNSVYDWRNCKHIPGNKYIVDEETNEVKQCIIQATAPSELHTGNNVLIENSVVFDGAYPNAVIQSSVSDNVSVIDSNFKSLENKANLKENTMIYAISTKNNLQLMYLKNDEKGGNSFMEGKEENLNEEIVENNEETTNENETVEFSNASISVNSEGIENSVDKDEDEAEAEVENTEETFTRQDILDKFDNISDNIEGLVKLAKEGLTYRQKVVEDALKSGVRAMGNSFNKEIFKKTFENLEISDIKAMASAWEEQVSEKFSTNKISKTENEVKDENTFEIKMDLKQFKTDNY